MMNINIASDASTQLPHKQTILFGGHYVRGCPFWFTDASVRNKYNIVVDFTSYSPIFVDFVRENDDTPNSTEIQFQCQFPNNTA